MPTNFSLGVGEEGAEKPLEVVPEELTNEVLELEWEHIAKKARENCRIRTSKKIQ